MLLPSQLCVSNQEESRWNCPVTAQNTVHYRYIKACAVGQSRYFVLILKWICSYLPAVRLTPREALGDVSERAETKLNCAAGAITVSAVP
jgi:hypothetical protein